MRMRPLATALLALTLSTLAHAAMAQGAAGLGGGGRSGRDPTGGAPKSQPQAAPTPPPVAVPGAVPRPDSVAPADRGAADLPPTEALFDAINRGDIVSARDAISRGADLDGTNLLGLTPLELSVDLGRNDLSFLLLSLRGTGGGLRGPPPATEASTTPRTPAERRRETAEAAAAARQARAQTAADARQARGAAPQSPALFAGNGGAAVPSAGFLGFDPHR